MREFLRPEFLARVDEIVVFAPLSLDSLKKIAALMLNELADALKEKLITFGYNDAVCEYIAAKCDGARSGARELRNIIRREIEDRVVDLVILGSEGALGKVDVSVKDGDLVIASDLKEN